MVMEAAAEPPGAGGVFVLPAFVRGSGPFAADQALGALLGLTTQTRRGQIVRAAFESLCFQMRRQMEVIERTAVNRSHPLSPHSSPSPSSSDSASGCASWAGDSGTNLWLQIKADVTGRPVEVLQHPEVTLMGVALLAGVGGGVYRDAREAVSSIEIPVTRLEPDREAQRCYEEAFGRFLELAPALRRFHESGQRMSNRTKDLPRRAQSARRPRRWGGAGPVAGSKEKHLDRNFVRFFPLVASCSSCPLCSSWFAFAGRSTGETAQCHLTTEGLWPAQRMACGCWSRATGSGESRGRGWTTVQSTRCCKSGDAVLCGVLGWGVYRTDENAERFEPASEGITVPQVCALAASPKGEGVVYAGTTPPHLYRSEDGGRSWRELAAFARAPGSGDWVYPAAPGYPNIRWVLVGPADPACISVGVEIGGLIRSEDGGETWQDRTTDMNRDIHCVAAHPAAPEVLFTATPAGPYRSDDGGLNWKHLWQGRSPSYSAQIAVHPSQPETVLVGISRGFRGGDAALFRSTDRGETWIRVTEQRPFARRNHLQGARVQQFRPRSRGCRDHGRRGVAHRGWR